MGDFQDVFGAGADADEIIDHYSRQYARASAREKVDWWGNATEAELEAAECRDELVAWRRSMVSRGYTEGPTFSTYAELSAWDRENKRPHIRRRNENGFEVFFTDRRPSDPLKSEDPLEREQKSPMRKLGGKMLPATHIELREDFDRYYGDRNTKDEITNMTRAWLDFEYMNKKRDNYWRTRLAAENLTDDDIDDALKLIFWFAGRNNLNKRTTPTRNEL
jgi:hypothetical protein